MSTSPRTAVPDDLVAFLGHLRRHAVRFAVDADLRHDPDQGGHPHAVPRDRCVFAVPDLPPLDERRSGRVGSDHATWSVAADLARPGLVPRGGAVWDIGVGTGMLAVVAHVLGAARIVATDVDEAALALAGENARAAGADVRLFAGSLLDAVPADEPAPDVVAANLPHKPRRAGDDRLPLAEDGGPEGDSLFAPFFEQCAARLPRGARVLFFQHSLPHPRQLAALAQHFDLRLLSWKRRFLARDEYGSLQDWFVERAHAGTSYVAESGGWRYLVACVWLATRR